MEVFVYILDNVYTREQILETEMAILNTLGWNLSVPTHYVFLSRFAKAVSSSHLKNDEEVKNAICKFRCILHCKGESLCAEISLYVWMQMENMVFFFAELALLQYALVPFRPSMVAAAAVYAARFTLKKTPLWTETLKHYTGFTESQLM